MGGGDELAWGFYYGSDAGPGVERPDGGQLHGHTTRRITPVLRIPNTSTSVIDVYQTDVHNQIVSLNSSTLGSQSPADYAGMQYDAVIAAFIYILLGPINYTPGVQEFAPNDNFFVGYSSLFEGPSDDLWSWNSNLATVLPSLMQNISVSLLNSQFSKEGNTTVAFDTTCWYSSSAYSYNEIRLLGTYGAALFITAVCMLFGFRAFA